MWKREAVQLLIELYEQNPYLYDTQNKNYFNRELRDSTLTAMCKELKHFKPDITVKEIKHKIRIIRTQFSAEFKLKNIHTLNNACDNNDVKYVPRLWCYEKLQFLENFTKAKKCNTSNIECDDENECFNQFDDEEELKKVETATTSTTINQANNSFQIMQIKSDPLDINDVNSLDSITSCDIPESPSTSTTNQSNKRKRTTMENDNDNEQRMMTFVQDNTLQMEIKRQHQVFADFIAAELGRIKDEEILEETKWNIQTCLHNGIKAQRQKFNFN